MEALLTHKASLPTGVDISSNNFPGIVSRVSVRDRLVTQVTDLGEG